MATLTELLSSPLATSLLHTHPNDLANPNAVPASWEPWWTWAAHPDPRWLDLVELYAAGSAQPEPTGKHANDSALDPGLTPSRPPIPPVLVELIAAIRQLQLPRAPLPLLLPPRTHAHNAGMSPKKIHEVSRMAAFTTRLLAAPPLESVRHAVDVGAGTGHLARALRAAGLHVLALDRNPAYADAHAATPPTPGAGSLTRVTAHITPAGLDAAVAAWLAANNADTSESPAGPVPVLVVALHACGSLTPDILRTILTHRSPIWTPAAAVVVGCCYNLMSPADFPLSRAYAAAAPLPVAALHLATQVPAQWLATPAARAAAALAVRKVVFRALLQGRIQSQADERAAQLEKSPGTGSTPHTQRLGRLPDPVYKDWQTFAAAAAARMDGSADEWARAGDAESAWAGALAVLHTLRCLLGPAIESLIIADRVAWVAETFPSVELVNLFDQAEGSARNVALVLKPLAIDIA